MKIYEQLAKIQQGLKAPKNLYNSFGKYAYRNAEGILESVKPLLGGMALIINDEPVMIGERYYIKATVTLTDGTESVSAVAYAREDSEKKGMDGCQLTGACSSYARKYALNALLMIDDSKDSDDDSLSPKNPANTEKITVNQQPFSKPEVKPVAKAPEKPVAKPVVPVKAKVETAAKIPPADPVKAYINNEIAFMSQRLEISDKKEMGDKFTAMRNALIESGTIPDIPSEKMTMEQAKNMIEAMYTNFFTDGGAA